MRWCSFRKLDTDFLAQLFKHVWFVCIKFRAVLSGFIDVVERVIAIVSLYGLYDSDSCVFQLCMVGENGKINGCFIA